MEPSETTENMTPGIPLRADDPFSPSSYDFVSYNDLLNTMYDAYNQKRLECIRRDINISDSELERLALVNAQNAVLGKTIYDTWVSNRTNKVYLSPMRCIDVRKYDVLSSDVPVLCAKVQRIYLTSFGMTTAMPYIMGEIFKILNGDDYINGCSNNLIDLVEQTEIYYPIDVSDNSFMHQSMRFWCPSLTEIGFPHDKDFHPNKIDTWWSNNYIGPLKVETEIGGTIPSGYTRYITRSYNAQTTAGVISTSGTKSFVSFGATYWQTIPTCIIRNARYTTTDKPTIKDDFVLEIPDSITKMQENSSIVTDGIMSSFKEIDMTGAEDIPWSMAISAANRFIAGIGEIQDQTIDGIENPLKIIEIGKYKSNTGDEFFGATLRRKYATVQTVKNDEINSFLDGEYKNSCSDELKLHMDKLVGKTMFPYGPDIKVHGAYARNSKDTVIYSASAGHEPVEIHTMSSPKDSTGHTISDLVWRGYKGIFYPAPLDYSLELPVVPCCVVHSIPFPEPPSSESISDLDKIKDFIDKSIMWALYNYGNAKRAEEKVRNLVGMTFPDVWTDHSSSPERSYISPLVCVDVGWYLGEDSKLHLGVKLQRKYARNFGLPFNVGETVSSFSEKKAKVRRYYYGYQCHGYDSSGSTAYNPGDMCSREGKVYVCISSTSGEFDGNAWDLYDSDYDPANETTLIKISPGTTIPLTSFDNVYANVYRDELGLLQMFGSNRYRNSIIDQFLYRDKSVSVRWYYNDHFGQVTPISDGMSLHPYQKGCSDTLLNLVKPVLISTEVNYEPYTTHSDCMFRKFWLPSLYDMYGMKTSYWSDDEEDLYWKTKTGLSSPSNAANNGRKICSDTDYVSPTKVMTRTCVENNPSMVYALDDTGEFIQKPASESLGLTPCCVIY